MAKRIGFLGDPSDARFDIERTALSSAAKALVVGGASNPVEFDAAVAGLIAQGVDVIYGTGSIVGNLRGRLIELANPTHLPVIGTWAAVAKAGALFSYGTSVPDQIRQSAHLVDKILKGAKTADVPVAQPMKVELVINLKAAEALDITTPQALLLRADEVIQ